MSVIEISPDDTVGHLNLQSSVRTKFTALSGDIDNFRPENGDPVNHPKHYTAASNGVECIEAIYAALENYKDPIDGWLAGQIIKYLWRAPLKGRYGEDLSKAGFYLERLLERGKGEKNDG